MRPLGAAMEKYLSKNWLCCVVIGLFTFLLWGQSLGYQFVWDDEIYIYKNPSIRSLANIPQFYYRMSVQSAEAKPTSRRGACGSSSSPNLSRGSTVSLRH